DLDEALKKFQDKINNLFGGKGKGKGGGGGSGGDLKVPGGLLAIIAAGALLLYLAFGFYQLDEQERAVVLRLGKYHETVNPGLHWHWPIIDRIGKINVTKVQSIGHRSVMLTEDENIVDLSITAQYRITHPKTYPHKEKQPQNNHENTTESELHQA